MKYKWNILSKYNTPFDAQITTLNPMIPLDRECYIIREQMVKKRNEITNQIYFTPNIFILKGIFEKRYISDIYNLNYNLTYRFEDALFKNYHSLTHILYWRLANKNKSYDYFTDPFFLDIKNKFKIRYSLL